MPLATQTKYAPWVNLGEFLNLSLEQSREKLAVLQTKHAAASLEKRPKLGLAIAAAKWRSNSLTGKSLTLQLGEQPNPDITATISLPWSGEYDPIMAYLQNVAVNHKGGMWLAPRNVPVGDRPGAVAVADGGPWQLICGHNLSASILS